MRNKQQTLLKDTTAYTYTIKHDTADCPAKTIWNGPEHTLANMKAVQSRDLGLPPRSGREQRFSKLLCSEWWEFFGFLTLEDGTDRFCRNVGTELSLNLA